MKFRAKILPVAFALAVPIALYLGKPDFGPNSTLRQLEARTEMADFSNGLRDFRHDLGRYPTTDEGLRVLVRRPWTIPADTWRGHYLNGERIPADPWGHDFYYKCPGLHNTNGYDLYSLGVAGKGGEAMIDNWTPPK